MFTLSADSDKRRLLFIQDSELNINNRFFFGSHFYVTLNATQYSQDK